MFNFLKKNLNKITSTHLKRGLLLSSLSLFIAACDHSDNTMDEPDEMPAPMEYQYQVTVANLTNGQPFSPIAVLLHASGNVWQIGEPASDMLEVLAESGDKSSLVAADFVLANASNDGILVAGEKVDITISTTDSTASLFSLVTMLVNTNDAFTGLNAIDLSDMAVDEMLTFKTAVYDAGTEFNSELIGTIPGPADGGEGFNASRDDVNFVTRHPGVVTNDDGLTLSVLNNQHKFDNPAMSVKIVRIK